jgi:hypothetical protein
MASAMSLTDAVKLAAGRPLPGPRRDMASLARTAPQERPERSLTQSVKKVARHERKPPATRTGRKGIVIYFDQQVASAIRRLGADVNATNQKLGEWAFRLLFEKYGEPWPA